MQQHIDDTLVAGAGLCIEDAVRVLVTEGPDEVAKLINRGAEFDRDLAGRLELTREGGHMRDRIAHAGGDATGAEIERALIAAVTADRGIEIVEHALVLDLHSRRGRPRGAAGRRRGDAARTGRGHPRRRRRCARPCGRPGHRRDRPDLCRDDESRRCPPVTGSRPHSAPGPGCETSSSSSSTRRCCSSGPVLAGQLPLVSEAVRGEGGLLVNARGERFMVGKHNLPSWRRATWSPRRS